MKKVKKNLKGMTLYEMIIAIAVFALMAVVLVGVGTHVDRTTRAANHLKAKLTAESQSAANRISKDINGDDLYNSEEVDITFTCPEVSYYNQAEDREVHDPHPNCTLTLKKYNTEAAVTGDKDTHIDPDEINANINLQFFETLPPTP